MFLLMLLLWSQYLVVVNKCSSEALSLLGTAGGVGGCGGVVSKVIFMSNCQTQLQLRLCFVVAELGG